MNLPMTHRHRKKKLSNQTCSILSCHSTRFLLCRQHHMSDHFRPSPPALFYVILYRTVGPITREVTLVLSTAVRILSAEGSCTRLSHVTALRARNIAGVVSCVALSSKVESIQSTPTTAQSLDHLHLRPHSSVPVFIGCPQRYRLQPLESRAQPCRYVISHPSTLSPPKVQGPWQGLQGGVTGGYESRAFVCRNRHEAQNPSCQPLGRPHSCLT